MMNFENLVQTKNWKEEKHMPVIDMPEKVKKGEAVEITVAVGKEIPHPNTLEHHIKWIEAYFIPEGAKNPVMLGRYEFSAHGEFDIFTEPKVSIHFKTEKSGTVLALSLCNIHGLWANSKNVKAE